jgi:LPXTG-site transpeptidase (sortase) family protein
LAPPTFLSIPGAKITAPIVDIDVQADGTMQAPPTPDVVGWYRTSARAGDPGNLVLAGHVDWGTNTAVFWGLRELSPSDPIIVRGADNVEHEYRVEWNRVFSRTDSAAVQYVTGSNDSILTLITCDGVYDRTLHDYSDRRIVRAILSDDR